MNNQDDSSRAKDHLASQVLDSYRFEFNDYAQWWRSLDQKAQGTVAIAGVILTAATGFIAATDIPHSRTESAMLGVLVLLLLVSLTLAILSLLVRETGAAPCGEDVDAVAREILDCPESQLADRVNGLVYDQAEAWREANKSQFDCCHSKSTFLRWAQVTILAAAMALATVAWLRIFACASTQGREGEIYEVQLQRVHQGREATGQPLRRAPSSQDPSY